MPPNHMRNDGSNVHYCRVELDSHADTIVLGSYALILQYTSRECDVSPYADTYEPIRNVPIVKGATAVTSSTTGETLVLVFNEAIWMGDHLDHSLLNPNQLRHYGIIVQDNPFDKTVLHLASHDNEFMMPMAADGTTIFFDSRTPTDYELQHSPHIVMSTHAECNPRDVQFPKPRHNEEEGDDMTYNLVHNMSGISSKLFDLTSVSQDEVSISRIITDRLTAAITISEVETRPDVPLPRTFASGR